LADNEKKDKNEVDKSEKKSEKSEKSDKGKKTQKKSAFKWFKDARSEFRKVTWPTPKQTMKNTSIVLVVLTIAGLSIFGFDTLLEFLFALALGFER
jgi:preprotein translocase subunit SecE